MNFITKSILIVTLLLLAALLIPMFKDYVDGAITPTGGWLRTAFGDGAAWIIALALFLPYGMWITVLGLCIYIGFKKSDSAEPPRIIR